VLVERYATLGGVCLNVGCIPSKALLHVAAVVDEAAAMAEHGISFGKPQLDLAKLRAWKGSVVGKLTGGLTGMAKARKVEVVRGYGSFLDAHHVQVELTTGQGQDKTGEKKVVRFRHCIIAAGSQAVRLPFMPDDPRIVDSTGALELPLSPTFTVTSFTVPAAGAGTSMVALSDSRVISGSSFCTVAPGCTSTSMTGTSLKSPMSGTFTSSNPLISCLSRSV